MQTSRWNWLSWLALGVALGATGLLALSGPGYRMGWFSLATALRQMLAWAAYAGIAAGVLALLALVLNGRRGTAGGRVAALVARGWVVMAADAPGRRIEATDTTYWFGFSDDIAVRVSAGPDGTSRVDLRSVSRVGRSDVGTNAARIRAFLADLAE